MLDLKSVKDEVMDLLDEFYTKEEMAEHLEQLVWARLYYFDEKLVELDRQLAEEKARRLSETGILPFTVGFSLACLASLMLYFWGC